MNFNKEITTLLDNSFTEIEPLHSDPATHSENMERTTAALNRIYLSD